MSATLSKKESRNTDDVTTRTHSMPLKELSVGQTLQMKLPGRNTESGCV